MSYDASSIRVLRDDEIADRFDWAKIGALASEFGVSEEWVRRGFAACREAGVPEQYFIERYLRKNPIPEHEGVTAAYKALHWPGRNRNA